METSSLKKLVQLLDELISHLQTIDRARQKDRVSLTSPAGVTGTCEGTDPDTRNPEGVYSNEGRSCGDPNTFLDMAQKAFLSGDYAQAAVNYEKAAKAGLRWNADSLSQFGESLVKIGWKRRALDTFLKAVRLAPNRTDLIDKALALISELREGIHS